MTALEAKDRLIGIRQHVIDQIRSLLRIRNQREIRFKVPLIYIEHGQENEVIDTFMLSDHIDVPDGVYTAMYGDQQQELVTNDLTIDQLIWVLEQVETENYEEL